MNAPPRYLHVIHEDDDLIVVDKPSGFHVHQPEAFFRRVPREITVLHALGKQTGRWLYPVHRLDVGTSGLLLMAFNRKTAAALSLAFQGGEVAKGYVAIARGYVPDEGAIDLPLELDSTGDPVAALTEFRTLERVELPHAVGKRHATARYSLVEARPRTGRYHQIRRHLARLSHPLIGDREHGDSHHNKFFRDVLGLQGLWLRAERLAFSHPSSGERLSLVAPPAESWREAGRKLGMSLADRELVPLA